MVTSADERGEGTFVPAQVTFGTSPRGLRVRTFKMTRKEAQVPTIMDTNAIFETFNVTSEDVDRVVAKIQELIHEGDVLRVVVKDVQGRTLMVVALTVGLVGAALVPVWTAIGAVAALVADCSIVVEKEERK